MLAFLTITDIPKHVVYGKQLDGLLSLIDHSTLLLRNVRVHDVIRR